MLKKAQYLLRVDEAVCVRALQISVRGKLLTQRATVLPTISSVLYAHLVQSL